MMKFEKIRVARQDARKRGAEMTGALLWAAFAIGVLISILGVYQVVQLNSNKTAATRTMSTISNEARGMFRNSPNFTGLTNQLLVDAGAVTNDAYTAGSGENAQPRITLGYDTGVVFAPTTGGFSATIRPGPGIRARNLCTFLNAGNGSTELINGPLGSDYVLSGSCSGDNAAIVATYAR